MSMLNSILSTMLPAALVGAALIGTTVAAQAVEADRPVKLNAELGQTAAGKGKTIFLRIGLDGIAVAREGRRTPVNVGLVIDRSGSMQEDDKIGRARDAAIEALGRLGGDDIASVTVFDNEVDVLLPAGRMTSQSEIRRTIDRLDTGGQTALYAGTDHGIREVEKFLARDRVNRVILISDGLANVGPSEPAEVAELGRKAAQKGITISTIGLGLGYNEDLMSRLAYASDGNHAFVEKADELVEIFNKEFGDVLSVVAQEIIIEIRCGKGMKPIRLLGREGDIDGSVARVKLAQLYGNQQKYAVLEVQVPDDASPGELPVADISVRYLGMGDGKSATLNTTLSVRITDQPEEQKASINKGVMGDVTTQLATGVQEEAVKLRDAGRVKEAKDMLGKYAAELDVQAATTGIPAAPLAEALRADSAKLDDEGNWNSTRKAMRASQHKARNMQSY
jgi:Ca-activated chloride channel homolog